MKLTRCDLCKKEIKGKVVNAGLGFYENIELCEKCGSPILKFLRKHRVIKEEINKNKIKLS